MQPIAPHGTHGDDVEDGEKGFPEPAPRYANAFDKLKLAKSVNFNEEDVSDKPGMIQGLEFADAGELQAGFRRRREAMLAVDDMVKRVVSVLTATGKLDNTYIVVTSDNGYSEGSHRYQGKIVLYEESIRVPLVISGPGVPKGVVRDQMVNNLDLVASIMDWAGATPGRTMDGRSLTPVLADAATPWRTGLLVENNHAFGIRTKDRLYTELESGQWGTERELYNLTADPGQMRNVINAPRYSDEIDQLHAILADLQSCAGASCWLGDAIPSASRGR